MKLLALDTSTEACSVALSAGEQSWYRFEICPRQHNRRLSEMLREVLDESGLPMSDIDALVCGVGPGSFTGIRIAVGMAQGLAASLQIPVAAVRGTESMAMQAFRRQPRASHVAVAMDARMSEIYWACYEKTAADELNCVEAERLAKPDAVRPPEDFVACGNAWQLPGLAAHHPERRVVFDDIYPDARTLLEIARARNQFLPPAQLAPLYLRAEVARKSA